MRYLIAITLTLTLASIANAQRRSQVCTGPNCGVQFVQPQQMAIPRTIEPAGEAVDALDVLNEQRRARGLFPFLRDNRLTAGALHVARFRASHRCQGHTANDMAGLPQGTPCAVAGCAAWPQGMGFGACEAYSTTYRYAGVASCVGPDGLVYHQLFCR